ncbi:Putative secreted protein [Tolypocladium paradoxum]|uniref:Secreted protein n=1 Tax=Tolypocladium paradoxum TaxID=94208 RepID=A0A2S4KZC5_9HYPO|nr:Putative secreted protein [Tolypocladium paradoxum]
MKFSASVLLSAVAVVLAAPFPEPTPPSQVESWTDETMQPGIPSATTAKTLLAGLQVAASGSGTGYSRDLFPHWVTISGTCNAREFVLKRDGTGVQTDSACAAVAGSWTSPYDGATWTLASDIDIDHMVPLKNAWISGASSWTTAQRQAFANDITRPQLWAVTDNVNQAKSDSSPDNWKPPLTSFYCTYAKSWVQVKSYYQLTITSAEKSALSGMLNTC